MCGIIGVVSRPPTRPTPTGAELADGLRAAVDAWPDLVAVAELVGRVDALLHGLPGVLAIVGQPDLTAVLNGLLDQLDVLAAAREAELDVSGQEMASETLEAANAELIVLRDALWAVRRDRFGTIAAVEATRNEIHSA